MAIRAIAVEDDEAVSRLIAQVLTSHGFEVVGTAATGEDGVALAHQTRPDVALVDLGLPKMSGEDVIATIRRDLPKTACIALTAVDIPARVLNAMRSGAAGYILKPFHASDLARAVEDVLSGEAAPISPRAAKVLLSSPSSAATPPTRSPPPARPSPSASWRSSSSWCTATPTPTWRRPWASPRARSRPT